MKTLFYFFSRLLAYARAKLVVLRIAPKLSQLLSPITSLPGAVPLEDWRIYQAHYSLSDMDVISVGPAGQPPLLMLHLPRSQSAISGFAHHLQTCESLRADPRLDADWKNLLPRLIYKGEFNHLPYYVMERIDGSSSALMKADFDRRKAALQTAFRAILHLHQATALNLNVDVEIFNHWALAPLNVIRHSTMMYYHPQSHALLDKLEKHLLSSIFNKPMAVCRIHGDYWPSNILFDHDGLRVIGIIDWDLSEPLGLPSKDLVNLFLSTRKLENSKMELGEIMAETLKRGVWRDYEQELWNQAQTALGGNFPNVSDAVLLFWVQHICAVLEKSWRYSVNPVFAYGNFVSVLRCLES